MVGLVPRETSFGEKIDEAAENSPEKFLIAFPRCLVENAR